MEFKIRIDDKFFWIFLAVVVFLIGAGYAVAIGENYAIHGHDQDEINLPSCGAGQILKYVGGIWSCQNDNTGSAGTLGCITVSDSSSGDTESVSCTSPRVMTGGGCNCGTLAEDSRPSGNGWYCACVVGGGGVTAYARCCIVT